MGAADALIRPAQGGDQVAHEPAGIVVALVRESQAARRSLAAIQSWISVVLPNPGGAETNVNRRASRNPPLAVPPAAGARPYSAWPSGLGAWWRATVRRSLRQPAKIQFVGGASCSAVSTERVVIRQLGPRGAMARPAQAITSPSQPALDVFGVAAQEVDRVEQAARQEKQHDRDAQRRRHQAGNGDEDQEGDGGGGPERVS